FTGPSLLAEGSIRMKWDMEGGWRDQDDQPLSGPMLVVGWRRGVRRWKDHELIEEFVDQPLPNGDELNTKVPQSEWELFDGVKQNPYSVWYAIYLISPPPDCVTYSFLNNTFGISICYGRITGQIKSMRGWCGDDARPIVELTDAPMPTDYGPKRRPHLKPIEWRTFGEPTLPAPAERVPQLPDQLPTDAERAEAIQH